MKKKNKAKKYIIISVITILIVALFIYISINAKKAMKEISKSYVVENTVERGNIEIKVTGSGSIEPITRAVVMPQMVGEVKTSNYKEGDKVKKDATIYKVEGVSIKAPIAGTLITKNYNKGDYVSTQADTTGQVTPLFVIADVSKMKVTLEVDELDVAKMKKGMNATIHCDATGKDYEGKVTKIAAEGKSQNGVTTYPVTVEINKPEDLKSGMNVDATIIVEKQENVLKIPMEAINREGDKSYVYVKDETYNQEKDKDSTTSFKVPSSMQEVKGYKKQEVKTGLSNKDEIEITEGLNEKDKVYSIGSSKSLTEYMMSGSSGMHSMMGE